MTSLSTRNRKLDCKARTPNKKTNRNPTLISRGARVRPRVSCDMPSDHLQAIPEEAKNTIKKRGPGSGPRITSNISCGRRPCEIRCRTAATPNMSPSPVVTCVVSSSPSLAASSLCAHRHKSTFSSPVSSQLSRLQSPFLVYTSIVGFSVLRNSIAFLRCLD